MGEEGLKSRVGAVCSNCHAKLPIELTQMDEKGENSIFCPYCGIRITFQTEFAKDHAVENDSEKNVNVKRKREKSLFLSKKEIHHQLRLFIYRNIYQIIKSKKTILRRLSILSDLSSSQIAHLSLKLRRTLLNASNPIQINIYTSRDPSVRKIERNLKTLKKLISKRKGFSERYAHLFAQNIEFVYNLIRGDYSFENLSETKRKIVLDLKELFGFKEESTSGNSAIFHLSLYLVTKIYGILKQKAETQLNKDVIDDITNIITESLITKDFQKEFFTLFQTSQKKKLAHFLSQFQSNVKYDWIYRTSVKDHIFKLIYLVNRLYLEKDAWTNLSGFEKLIADYLKENSLLQDDPESSSHFELNLTLILCRIIYKMMQDLPSIPKTISKIPALNPSLKQEMIDYISNEIAAQKKINFEFLGKFYKLSLEEYQTIYEKFQSGLLSDMILYQSFQNYLEKLIKIVYVITHSISRKSKLSTTEQVIIKDLANYTFRWNSTRGRKYYFYSDKEIIPNETKKAEFQDVFTKEIADDDPLWRVRAYVIGFLLADGYIQTRKNSKQRKNRIIIKQHKRDLDILEIMEQSLGGKIKPSTRKNILSIEINNKNLALNLLKYGMIEAHSKREKAINMLPPQFIERCVNGQSLIRDFVRGFYDGDGWFCGSCEECNPSFQILGPNKFISKIRDLILKEVPELTFSIYNEKLRVIKYRNEEYRLYGKFKIYIPKKGFRELRAEEIQEAKIENRNHPWLKVLTINGSINVINFFNWIYENNDHFNKYKIKGILLCGKRKFFKALKSIGSEKYRKERLAPSFKDVIPEVIISLEKRYYETKELNILINNNLKEKLLENNLEYLYSEKRSSSKSYLRERLKLHEFRDEIIGSYQKRVGRSNINYYYNRNNPPDKVPPNFRKKIYILNRNGEIRRNVKNYIIYFFLKNENKLFTFKEVNKEVSDTEFIKSKNVRPNKLMLEFLELRFFNLLLVDDPKADFSDQKYLINISKLTELYKIDKIEAKKKLSIIFK